MKVPSVKVVLINKDALTIKVNVPGTTSYKFKNLDVKINPAQWDKKAGVCKKGHRNYEFINRMIATERNSLVDAFEKDRQSGVMFTAAHISQRLEGSELNPTDFCAFCREQIAISNYSKESRRTYLSEVSKIENYTPTLSFAEITFKWLQGYENYMRSKLANHPNTIWKTFKFINTMCNAAIKVGGIITENPLKDYNRGKYKQGMPVYLSWDEMLLFKDAVKNKPLPEHTKLIGYYALLSYFSGLRFSDAVSFDYSKKVIEQAGGNRIVLNTKKTGEIVSIIFTSHITEIVDYIRDKPLNITNQEFNEHIKIIKTVAGIEKDISSHSFRHGFAVRCTELDMSIDEVQKLLGHNKRQTTEIYFRILDKRLDDAMKKWESPIPKGC